VSQRHGAVVIEVNVGWTVALVLVREPLCERSMADVKGKRVVWRCLSGTESCGWDKLRSEKAELG
jgi:hypothetical protein